MKQKKITDKELKLLILLAALILLAISYFGVFQHFSEAAEVLETANVEDTATLTQLQSMVAREQEVRQETEDMNREREEIIAKYPVDVPQEKAIYLVQELEDLSGSKASSISFTMNNAVASTLWQLPQGYYDSLAITYEASYESLKKWVLSVEQDTDRMTIPSVSAAYDEETGNLKGVITVNMYYLTGTEKEYEPPVITGIGKGTSDIFRSSGVRTSGAGASGENGGDTDGNTDNSEQ